MILRTLVNTYAQAARSGAVKLGHSHPMSKHLQVPVILMAR